VLGVYSSPDGQYDWPTTPSTGNPGYPQGEFNIVELMTVPTNEQEPPEYALAALGI